MRISCSTLHGFKLELRTPPNVRSVTLAGTNSLWPQDGINHSAETFPPAITEVPDDFWAQWIAIPANAAQSFIVNGTVKPA